MFFAKLSIQKTHFCLVITFWHHLVENNTFLKKDPRELLFLASTSFFIFCCLLLVVFWSYVDPRMGLLLSPLMPSLKKREKEKFSLPKVAPGDTHLPDPLEYIQLKQIRELLQSH